MRTTLLVCACALTAISPSASADGIAVVPLAATGDVPAEELEQIADAVAAELRARGHDVLLPSDARVGIERGSPGCMAAPRISCMAEGLYGMQWSSFVGGRVIREPDGQTSISLELYETRGARQIAAQQRRGPVSERAQSLLLAREAAVAILESLARGARRALVHVISRPNGATLRVRGGAVGRTPWTGHLAPGHVSLQLDLEGYEAAERELELEPGGAEELVVELERDPGSSSPGPGRPIVGPLLLGIAGLALLAVDAVVLATSRCDQEAPDGTCLRGERASVVPVILVGAAGVLSIGGGLTWFLLGGSSEPEDGSVR
ncbi:MAG: PEGA domain-containing protein [Deltaproteobacteria bacterium]|nr:PEGA domain-containing protein [Deltaproteobacteria bacterium]